MSYDFTLLRLQKPVASLREVDETTVSWDNWFESARTILLRDFGYLEWNE